ncbi:MAG: hypothetical protein JXR72_05305 [Proteobacteria bacterium]|nr:hypothetical protein [Pseudomonadota bacterium]
MPQIFSAAWLYLFVFLMVLGLIYIIAKIRVIHREQDPDTPVIKVAPVVPPEREPARKEKGPEVLEKADLLIREGRFDEAIDLMSPATKDLSPVEDRDALGKLYFRIGACQRRLGWDRKDTSFLLRSGEALREAVNLFAPHRLRSLRLGALSELAGLYEDLADRQNRDQNLADALKTWEAASRTARVSGQPSHEAVFLSRQADVFRKMALVSNPEENHQKALEIYEKALAAPDAFPDAESLLERAGILKKLGDLKIELAGIRNSEEDIPGAIKAFEEALGILTPQQHPGQRGHTLLSAGRGLLEVFKGQGKPVHLGQSLKYLGEAATLLRTEKNPSGKGHALVLLGEGMVLLAQLKGRPDYLEKGIKFYEAALGFLKDPEFAAERDRIREELKQAVEKRHSFAGET